MELGLNLTEFVTAVAVIAGVTELIARLRAKDYWVAVTILSAVVVGALFGALHYYADLDVAKGIALGFATSGTISAVGAKRSTPMPSSDVVAVKGGK